MSPNGFEFHFTDLDGGNIHFTIDGIITGLAAVPAVTVVGAVKITEVREDITASH